MRLSDRVTVVWLFATLAVLDCCVATGSRLLPLQVWISQHESITPTFSGVDGSLQKNPWGLPAIKSTYYPSMRSETALLCRGGSHETGEGHDEDLNDESDDEEDVEEENFDEAFDEKFKDSGDDDDDFKEASLVDRAIEEYIKTPPMTKAYVTISAILTLTGCLFYGNQFPPMLTLDWNKVFKEMQLWRLLTTFFNFGGFGLGYGLTINFMSTYMSQMERIAHNKPYDFWIMILFGMTSMLVFYSALKIDGRFLGHNLSTYMVYIWSKTHDGDAINVFGLIESRAELLPWIFLAQVREMQHVQFHGL